MPSLQRRKRVDVPRSAFCSKTSNVLRILLAAREIEDKIGNGQFNELDACERGLSTLEIGQLVDAGLLNSNANRRRSVLKLTRWGESVCREVLHAFEGFLDGTNNPIPRWDSAARLLTFDGEVVKQFRRTAPNQERLLSEFQKLGWPECINNPLPVDDDIVPSERLRETIKSLNGSLDAPPIRFRGDGTGRGVSWGSSGK